jgi:hypothetical protein
LLWYCSFSTQSLANLLVTSFPVLQLVLTAAILFQAFTSSRASKQNATFGVLRQLAAGQETAKYKGV